MSPPPVPPESAGQVSPLLGASSRGETSPLGRTPGSSGRHGLFSPGGGPGQAASLGFNGGEATAGKGSGRLGGSGNAQTGSVTETPRRRRLSLDQVVTPPSKTVIKRPALTPVRPPSPAQVLSPPPPPPFGAAPGSGSHQKPVRRAQKVQRQPAGLPPGAPHGFPAGPSAPSAAAAFLASAAQSGPRAKAGGQAAVAKDELQMQQAQQTPMWGASAAAPTGPGGFSRGAGGTLLAGPSTGAGRASGSSSPFGRQSQSPELANLSLSLSQPGSAPAPPVPPLGARAPFGLAKGAETAAAVAAASTAPSFSTAASAPAQGLSPLSFGAGS
eukprot:jgi/Mesen1/9634/ME000669S09075